MFEAEISFFLLRDAGDGWKLIEIAIGPTDIAWDWWCHRTGFSPSYSAHPPRIFSAS